MPTSQSTRSPTIPLLYLGFRCFFFMASLFSVSIVLIWGLYYTGYLTLGSPGITPYQWHAHEMIYGYCSAVIIGFLLTASRNWTGRETLKGWPLAGLALVWLTARLLWLMPSPTPRIIASFIDSLFLLLALLAIGTPIMLSRQYRQLGLLAKLLLLFILTIIITVGLAMDKPFYIQTGVYAALYIVLGVILTIGRRVIPMFINRGLIPLEINFTPKNSQWLDRGSLLCFLCFFIADLSNQTSIVSATFALLTGSIIMIRLLGWHHPGIWRAPLLWSLWLALAWVALGFGLYALHYWGWVKPFLAVHAWSYGGIGLITLSMMARVSLGHTGRNLYQPSRWVGYAFIALNLGAIARVIAPIIVPQAYLGWIIIADGLWILAFILILIVYTPIWNQPRIDGQPG